MTAKAPAPPATPGGTLVDWADAMVSSTAELARTSLGFDHVGVTSVRPGLPAGLAGAYIALVGDEHHIQFGLVADPDTCDRLARALLMLDADEEICPDDMVDAIGEIANMIGGGVKRRMIEADPSMRLGLPVFIKGSIVASAHLDAWSAAVALADVTVHLVVLRHRG